MNFPTKQFLALSWFFLGWIMYMLAVPIWLQYNSPYFAVTTLLVTMGIVYFVVYIVTVIVIGPKYKDAPNLKTWWWLILGMAGSYVCYVMFVIFSSPPDRTPPVLQMLLSNVNFLFAPPVSYMLIPSKRGVNYCHGCAIIGFLSVTAGVGVSMVPDIMLIASGEVSFSGGQDSFIFSLFMLFGYIVLTVYGVLQERFILDRDSEVPYRNTFYDRMFLLGWSGLFQAILIVVLMPVDAISGFGDSDSIVGVVDTFKDAMLCSFGVTCDGLILVLTLLTIFSSFMANISFMLMNESSANFTLITSSLLVPIGVVIMKFVPALNVDPQATPIWAISIATVLILTGVVVWRIWEIRYGEAQTKVDHIN